MLKTNRLIQVLFIWAITITSHAAYENQVIFKTLNGEVAITSSHVESVKRGQDQDGAHGLSFRLNKNGQVILGEFIKKNVGEELVAVFHGEELFKPTIIRAEFIPDFFQLSTKTEAQAIAVEKSLSTCKKAN